MGPEEKDQLIEELTLERDILRSQLAAKMRPLQIVVMVLVVCLFGLSVFVASTQSW